MSPYLCLKVIIPIFLFEIASVCSECTIPIVLRNTWFSFENGKQTITDINASDMTGRGVCENIKADYHVNYTMVFRYTNCYYCVKLIVRTVNVLEKIETPCVDLALDEEPTVERECGHLDIKTVTVSLESAPIQMHRSGHWFVGKNHFFAVANTKESRKDERYRCFLKNRDDDLYLGASITPECSALKTVEKSPERYKVTPVKAEVVEPGCRLPQNFSGQWINTANIDADVFINETHIIETYYPDEERYRRTIYVCREQRDSRVMMARLTVDGCQKDFVCFDFVPQHHNIIRYRKGLAMIQSNFHTVCSWVQFPNKKQWRYDLFLKKDPSPIRCPVAGKFNFTQRGDVRFETRIIGGVTLSPRPNLYCKLNISDFSVCDIDQKTIQIKENYCLSVDYLGRPVDIYSDPDYRMKCIGYWKENLKSYLITYDELDPFSKYRCWVYQRADLNRILMSQALGPYCDLKQDVTSWNYTEGAAVAVEMEEYERERDQCPMHFDDGSDPWTYMENNIKIFKFTHSFWKYEGNHAPMLVLSFKTFVLAVLIYLL
ncbi:hypothetical protein MSG28_007683 [Choristoneura fumiferana]|uniref:Uncharacterized protein n=1 Tax=Choristoneura fumiferana TaxID=7141 RepID=A0ACC0JYE1_CHOFU|nr:hypothetical protein MSG28_007683 [Choristoneura fumiferana]